MEDGILFRYLRREVTPSEAARIAEWRESDPAAQERLDELSRLIAAADRRARQFSAGRRPGAREIVRLADAKMADATVRAPRCRSRMRTLAWTTLAAAAGLAAVAAASHALLQGGRGAQQLRAQEFRTGESEMTTVQLDDGTVVRLAPETTMRIDGGVARRHVQLDGRAFFAVAPMSGRPFVVQTPAGAARVLGTRFDISTHRDTLSLVVVEGRVAVSGRDGREVEVAAGEMARVAEGRTMPRAKVNEAATVVEWMGNFLVFQSDPLGDAAKEIERRYGVRVVIEDSALANETVSAWFVDQRIDEVVQVICLTVRATCSQKNGVVRISR